MAKRDESISFWDRTDPDIAQDLGSICTLFSTLRDEAF